MRQGVVVAVLCGFLLGCNEGGSDALVPSFKLIQPMDSHDTVNWIVSGDWANGDPFVSGFCASQVSFGQGALSQGVMNLSLETKNCAGKSYASGEYRTKTFYGYGYYEARLKAAPGAGIVTGFFTYTGPSDGNVHDEIDVEILGKDPTKLQVNYWTNGVEHPTTIALGFDASQDYHTYAFDWQPSAIKWYVDGKLVHTETGSNGALPSTAGRIMANLWACNATSWCGSYTPSATPVLASFDWIGYR